MSKSSPFCSFSFRVLALGLLMTVSSAFGEAPLPKYTHALDIPPRLQWNANFGYCGEVSMISAGLFYGQYCSQYKARELASPGVPQDDEGSQLLVGVNDVDAADAMHLVSEEWDTEAQNTTREFALWIKDHILQDHPVITGLFANQYLFYEDTDRKAGDDTYDHVVPVTGYGAQRPLDRMPVRYAGSDTIFFSDNGLWDPDNDPPYNFRSRFSQFFRSRSSANSKRGQVYSLNNDRSNYGIAITGVKDLNNDTIPVRLATNVNYESPEMVDGSTTAPAAMALTVTATVTIPDQSKAYNLYRYDNFEDVPDSQFNANASDAAQTWSIPSNSGATYVVPVNIMSNDVAVFRAVATTAP